MAQLLIVDDECELCYLVARIFTERGHQTQCVSSGEAALRAVAEQTFDLILLDLHLEGLDGMETLRRLRSRILTVPVVILTAFGNIKAAVKAMKLGATDFVSKPFNNQALIETVEMLIAMRHTAANQPPILVGESPAFQRVVDLALKFAIPQINVLLLGETGTGKELFAQMIHTASKRRDGPFVAVDCAILAENLIESELFGHEKGSFTGAITGRIGRLELAQGGTLFLDEIGNLPLEFQAKLLRVLQERRLERVGGRETIPLDVRVISATNVNLLEAIRQGTFRQDLYYRLQEMTICLPSLRERRDDVGLIAEHFRDRYAQQFSTGDRSISPAARQLIERYAWPGNVRELENAMKSAVILATEEIRPEHLPEPIRAQAGHALMTNQSGGPGADDDEQHVHLEIEIGLEAAEIDLKALGSMAAEQAERSLLQVLLRRRQMSGAQMARLLGVDPKTLRTKLRRYGLEGRVAPEG